MSFSTECERLSALDLPRTTVALGRTVRHCGDDAGDLGLGAGRAGCVLCVLLRLHSVRQLRQYGLLRLGVYRRYGSVRDRL